MHTNQDDKRISQSLLEVKPENITLDTAESRLVSSENHTRIDSLQEDTEDQELETPSECSLRKKSHYVIHATTFITSIGFSIVLTGVWPYLKQLDPSVSKEFLGWVVALNPLGQMITSPLLGWISSRNGSNRTPLLVTMVMFVAGNLLYAILPLFHRNAIYVMLLSRFIVGVSSANIALCRSYISMSTRLKERTTGLSIIAAAQSMGYILGPIIQTVIAFVFQTDSQRRDDVLPNGTHIQYISPHDDGPPVLGVFNMYSLTGWITAALGFLNFFILLPCIYTECNIAEKEEKLRAVICNSSDNQRRKSDYSALFIVLFGYFSILLIYVLLETLIVPISLDMYGWTDEFAVKAVGIGLTIAGVITLFMFIFGGKMAKRFGDRKVLILCGLIPMTISLLLFFPVAGETPPIKNCPSPVPVQPQHNSSEHLDFNSTETNTTVRIRRSVGLDNENECQALGCPASQEWCTYTPIIHIPQMLVASLLVTIGYPIGISLSGAIFSKMLKVKAQGLWMGILTSAGSLSRFLGPIFVSYIYTAKGPLWTFAILFILFLFVLALYVIFYRRMAPLSTQSGQGASPS